MPTINFENLGDVLDYTFCTRVIESVKSEDDTCVLSSGETALIFYHCTPEAELRSNGAIEGSASGFSAGDEVIVLLKDSVTYVVGHTDGVRHCEYYLRCRFNGNLPITGGERVLIRNKDQVYPLSDLGVKGIAKWVEGGTGLCGPFSQAFEYNTYAYVNTRNNSGNDLCNLFRLSTIDNYDYIIWTFNGVRTVLVNIDGSTQSLDTFAFGMLPKDFYNPDNPENPYHAQVYLNRVQRVRNTVLLKDIQPSTALIDGKSVVVYDVNFEMMINHTSRDNGITYPYPFSSFPNIEDKYEFEFKVTEEFSHSRGAGLIRTGHTTIPDLAFSGGSGYIESVCEVEFPSGSGHYQNFGSVIGLSSFRYMITTSVDVSQVCIIGTEDGPESIPGELQIIDGLFVSYMYHRCYSRPVGSQYEFSSNQKVSRPVGLRTMTFVPTPVNWF